MGDLLRTVVTAAVFLKREIVGDLLTTFVTTAVFLKREMWVIY